jgi:hypothetical protein
MAGLRKCDCCSQDHVISRTVPNFEILEMLIRELSYYLFCFLCNKIGKEEGRTGSAWKRAVGGGGAKNVYTCK